MSLFMVLGVNYVDVNDISPYLSVLVDINVFYYQGVLLDIS